MIAFAKDFLNQTFPLAQAHADATKYAVVNNGLAVTLKDGSTTSLVNQFVGFNGDAANQQKSFC